MKRDIRCRRRGTPPAPGANLLQAACLRQDLCDTNGLERHCVQSGCMIVEELDSSLARTVSCSAKDLSCLSHGNPERRESLHFFPQCRVCLRCLPAHLPIRITCRPNFREACLDAPDVEHDGRSRCEIAHLALLHACHVEVALDSPSSVRALKRQAMAHCRLGSKWLGSDDRDPTLSALPELKHSYIGNSGGESAFSQVEYVRQQQAPRCYLSAGESGFSCRLSQRL